MLEQSLTTELCKDMIAMLQKRRKWTLRGIARMTGRPLEYIERVQSQRQSFQMSDVEALARACKVKPYRLVFDSLRRENFAPGMEGLYDLGLREVESAEEFERAMTRKTTKKRRTRRKAA
jgi:hypothetical protein